MRVYIVLVALLSVINQTYAQVDIGIKAGPSLVTVAFEDSNPNFDEVFRPSFHAGVYSLYYFNEKLVGQIEILFANKGYRTKYKDRSDNTNLHLSYISLPILAGYQFSEKFRVQSGPEISYLLSVNSSIDNPGIELNEYWDRKIDIGIATGVTCQVYEKINISIRYIHSLLNTISREVQITNERGEPAGTAKIKSQNRVFQLSASYRLN